ncbi:MAG: hypothetical protein WCO23_03540 [bacterium]
MKIIDIENQTIDTDCLGCSIAKDEYSPLGGNIYSSDNFCIGQDCEIPINGFIIISTKRHIQSIDEFTEEEKTEYINILAISRKALREVLNIESIFIIQTENQEHHFHTCLLPITQEMAEKFGTGFRAIKPYMEYAKENLKTKDYIKLINESITQLREYLKAKV